MTKASEDNIKMARNYRASLLDKRRKEFYQQLLDCVSIR